MKRPLLTLLPALLAALPAAAAIIGDISAGDKQKDVQKKAKDCSELVSSDAKASLPKIDSYALAAQPAGQQWRAVFNFDKRSKELQSITFVSAHGLSDKDYKGLVKAFYFYSATELAKHFGTEESLNTPAFGKASALKAGEPRTMLVFRGGKSTLATGLQRDKKGTLHVWFSLAQTADSALGATITYQSDGKPDEWAKVPTLDTYPEGKEFLVKAGVLKGDGPDPAEDEGTADEAEADSGSGDSADEEPAADEPAPEEPDTTPTPAPAATKTAPTNLPQAEQDTLNALFLIEKSHNKDGMEKLVAAAKAGNGMALYELGLCHLQGLHGLPQNPELAEKTFRKAAQEGYALALVRFGGEYATALAAIQQSEAQGKRVLDKVLAEAKKGLPSARFNLAIMLRYGYGIRKDVAKAVETMQQLATEGIPGAAELAEEWAK